MPKTKLHAFILTALFAAAAIASISVKPLTASERVSCDFTHIPASVGGYVGTDEKFSSETYTSLPSASLLLRKYALADNSPAVELAIVYGVDLGDFHQPEICLAGQGLRVLHRGTTTVTDSNGKVFDVVSLVTESDYGQDAFLYWFSSKDSVSTSLGNYKARLLLSRLQRKAISPSAMVRMSVPVHGSPEEALARLAAFAGKISPYVDEEIRDGAKPR